jgi:hypothetical protein
MPLARPLVAAVVFATGFAMAATAGPYYARGTFYCTPTAIDPGPGTTCWGWESTNELFDDGLHGDGAAGDGIYGADIACTGGAGRYEFKIATNDWSEAYPTTPYDVFANAVLFTSQPNEVIHFTLDARVLLDGWQPLFNSVSTSHAYPEGTVLELIGSAPELGNWITGVPVNHVGNRWQKIITIADPGFYEFKFRAQGTWDVVGFGYDYNNTAGRNAILETEFPFTDVLFQFDEPTGRVRGIELGPTPARASSWGRVKALYR